MSCTRFEQKGLMSCLVIVIDKAFVIWCHNQNVTTYLVGSIPTYCDEALQEACKFKLKKALIWEPPSGLDANLDFDRT
ncbi:hypothetical protein KXD40_001103 [Peronospora effusa]|uniref:Uncharacterized protein n=1 Tax=Peronospora effusa TaxID=542832 RepID=A0A425C196_9STRA|nr:hypothetical protein DD237_008385 [Peronospora effusa]UIZ20866.1 hypothetical protein KXD40_001103 [Peronospora effusa]